jgi:transcriptional regulator with XRE-family HTH domain
MEVPMASIGENIRKLRKARKMTQAKLAELTGIDEKSISFYENGKRNVPSDCLVPLADALGVTVDVLVGRTEMTDQEDLVSRISRAILDVLKDYDIRSRK